MLCRTRSTADNNSIVARVSPRFFGPTIRYCCHQVYTPTILSIDPEERVYLRERRDSEPFSYEKVIKQVGRRLHQ